MVRPREYNREELADKLIAWAKKDDSINLCSFCGELEMAPGILLRMVKEDNRLSEAYDLAKAFLGARREVRLSENKLHVKAYDLNAKTYDRFLKEEGREEMQFQSSLKASENDAIDDANLNAYLAVMEQITKAQNQLSRRIASKISNDDEKS